MRNMPRREKESAKERSLTYAQETNVINYPKCGAQRYLIFGLLKNKNLIVTKCISEARKEDGSETLTVTGRGGEMKLHWLRELSGYFDSKSTEGFTEQSCY